MLSNFKWNITTMRSRKQRISFKIILKVRVQKEDEKDRGRLKPKCSCPTEKLGAKPTLARPWRRSSRRQSSLYQASTGYGGFDVRHRMGRLLVEGPCSRCMIFTGLLEQLFKNKKRNIARN